MRITPIPFAAFTAEFLSLYDAALRAPGTRAKIKHALGLVAELGVTTTADLTPALVARLIASRPPGQSPATVDGLLRALRVACRFAVDCGYLRASPFTIRPRWGRISIPKTADKQRHHPAATIARALEIARADIGRKKPRSPSQWRARRLYALASLVAYTGIRKNEAIFLRVEDIDIPGRVINIVCRAANRLKTEGSEQPVPMPEALAVVLSDWLPHLAIPAEWPELATAKWSRPASNPTGKRDAGWVFPNTYRTAPWTGGPKGRKPLDQLKRLGERAGAEGFTFLSLRHSWATMAESKWGLTDLQIQRVLRQTNVRSQRVYRHADLTNLRAAVKDISFGGELPAVAPPAELPAPPAAAPVEPAIAEPTAPPRPINPKNPSKPGVRHPPKLTVADVVEIRELRAQGWKYCELQKRFPVSKSTINNVLFGGHRHVPRPPEIRQ